MVKKQKVDIKEKSIEVLKKEIEEAKKALFNLHLDNKLKKLKNTRSIFMKRKEVARLLTLLNMKSAAASSFTKAADDKKAMADKGGKANG